MDQVPSVGRIVHFKMEKDGPCLAAIITSVNIDGTVSLQVFRPFESTPLFARVYQEGSGDPFNSMVGSWHWPERV